MAAAVGIQIYRSTSTGIQTGALIDSSNTYNCLIAKDIGGDGFLDIVGSSDSGTSVFRGTGGGNFTLSQALSNDQIGSPTRVWQSDLNGDGIPDFVVQGNAAKTSVGLMMVLIGREDGTLEQGSSVSITTEAGATLGFGDLNGDGVIDMFQGDTGGGGPMTFFGGVTTTNSEATLDLYTRESALRELANIDAALTRVNTERSTIGAGQSRLLAALQAIAVARENFDAARGRLVDADVAAEAATVTRQRILQQSATAVLAQANQAPALAIQLLKTR